MRYLWVIVVALCCLGEARADTGGSMGGGSWSSHSSSSSSGGGSFSSSSSSHSYSSSSSSSSYSSSGGGGGDLSIGWIFIFALGGIAWLIISAAVNSRNVSNDNAMSLGLGEYTPSTDTVDVTTLRIALDGRSRKFVQRELARIAKIADTKTEDGRATMLREVTVLLRRLRDGWIYGGAVNQPMREIGAAKAVFDREVGDARARFTDETIRNEQGVVTTAVAPASIPRSEEGAGVILVSIVVAARSELFTVAHIGDGEDLRKALETAAYRDQKDLVAIEIVWQPSEDDDRLSSIELEAKYPKPQLIPILGALVGKTFCAYCGGPFPAELVSCPHCGAPARAKDA